MKHFNFKLKVSLWLCLLISIPVSFAAAPSWSDRTDLLNFHMKIRESVQPPAANMRSMSYSYDMQKLAEDWVATCVKKLPDSNKDRLYFQTHSTMAISYDAKRPSMLDMAKTWEGEKKSYSYASNSCKGTCSNYKTLIWAYNTHFGCAVNTCDASKSPDKKAFHIMGCVYKTLRPQEGIKPYVEGESCSNCPPKFSCHRNQCLQAGSAK